MKRPTAAQRTLSMFTGLADIEAHNARDGSRGEPVNRPPAKKPKDAWKSDAWGGGQEWYRANQRLRRVREGVYVLTHGGEDVGEYPTVIDAANAADKLLAGGRRR